MKIDNVEYELCRVAPRTTSTGDNFVKLVAYGDDNTRVSIKLTSDELTSIINKLSSLSTIKGEY